MATFQWDPTTDVFGYFTLSNSNLTATNTGGASNSAVEIYGNIARPANNGPYYVEFLVSVAGQGNCGVGLGVPGVDSVYYWSDGTIYYGASTFSPVATFTDGDVIGVSMDNGVYSFYKNGAPQVTVYPVETALTTGLVRPLAMGSLDFAVTLRGLAGDITTLPSGKTPWATASELTSQFYWTTAPDPPSELTSSFYWTVIPYQVRARAPAATVRMRLGSAQSRVRALAPAATVRMHLAPRVRALAPAATVRMQVALQRVFHLVARAPAATVRMRLLVQGVAKLRALAPAATVRMRLAPRVRALAPVATARMRLDVRRIHQVRALAPAATVRMRLAVGLSIALRALAPAATVRMRLAPTLRALAPAATVRMHLADPTDHPGLAWVVNTATGAVSTYHRFHADRLLRVHGATYAIVGGQLRRLFEDETDGGLPIRAAVQPAVVNAGADRDATLGAVYLGVRETAGLEVDVIYDEDLVDEGYQVAAGLADGRDVVRVKFGRAPRGNLQGLRIINRSGGRLDIHSLALQILGSKRKV